MTAYTFGFDKFHFFWDGPFSQWHPSKFTVNDQEFNCAEQFMMYHKAMTFADEHSAKLIMQAKHPKKQKELGRGVTPFDPEEWASVSKTVVTLGSLAKFQQNPDLMNELYNTRGTLLVEASPYDRIWGIGLGADAPGVEDPGNWKGSNWLGEVLTIVRMMIHGE